MLYGLVSTPFVFQGFMNELFWEYLNRFVIIYIDDIDKCTPRMRPNIVITSRLCWKS